MTPGASPSVTPTTSVTPTASVTPSLSPSSSVTPTPSTSLMLHEKSNKSDAGVIAGAVLGSTFFIFLAAVIGFFSLRIVKREKRRSKEKDIELSPKPQPDDPLIIDRSPIYDQTALAMVPASQSQSIYAQTSIAQVPSTDSIYANVPPGMEWHIEYSELKLTQEIGRGAFGVVYKGLFKGRMVAVKQAILDPSSLSGNSNSPPGSNQVQSGSIGSVASVHLQDFFAEADVMKKLKPHPNLTLLIGVVFHPVCIVLEYVDNGSLWHWLVRNQPDTNQQFSIAQGIAAGMQYLHSEGIIHRDLAARNILLDSNLVPKVSDFGMSRQVLENKTNKTTSEIGPIRWMAPEALRRRVYNQKTDVWSYGVVMYEILTRKIPFHELDLVHVATSVSLKELSLVPEIKENAEKKKYPAVLVSLLETCLNYVPEERPEFDTIMKAFDSGNEFP
eukprot:CAMPEP_0168575864 /NCGR_PEP_ID=MMETSP0413-20121227/19928_1 /TAXON_ID=136452 /ORGANISM="Filamoeba nolandi, Strain NC-AS-23-1" /LENGTH=443 /DNA_ID=CAMNT_0008609475 /DNA_START=5 /DNA_END=1333 /DNA_ORIENTATION=+